MLIKTPRFAVKFRNGGFQVFDSQYYGGVQWYESDKRGRLAAEKAAQRLNERHGGGSAPRR